MLGGTGAGADVLVVGWEGERAAMDCAGLAEPQK